MNHLIMLSIWLSLVATQTSAPPSTDQKPLFPSDMFVLTLAPTNPLEGTAFKPIHLSGAPTSTKGANIVYIRGGDADFSNPRPIPLRRANVSGDFR
jgi:hypothetical protein